MPISRHRKKKPKLKNVNSKQLKASDHSIERRQEVTVYQGLIPSPEMMEAYKNVDPSIPIKIMEWTTKEGDHRREIEKTIVRDGRFLSTFNSICGLVAVGLIATLSYLFMIHGNSLDGRWIACATIVSLAGIFVLRKWIGGSKKPQ